MNIAFVPVRAGSKSIPFKNIKNFCGKPLVYWCLQALQKCNYIEKIYVATDSDKIKFTVNSFKLSKVTVYDRDPDNANDMSSTESVMLEFLKKKNFDDNDIFFLVQATSPLTQTEDFVEAFDTFQNQNADSLLTCVRTKKFIWNEDFTPNNYDYKNRPLRQSFQGMLVENGAFYINTVSNIINYKNRLSGKIVIHEMKQYKEIEIDEEDDWKIAENLMRKYIINEK